MLREVLHLTKGDLANVVKPIPCKQMKALTYFKTYETTLLSLVPCERGDFKNELKEIQECIAELEVIQDRSCLGCKHNYEIVNVSADGVNLESVFPQDCYMCSRNMNDRYEAKESK